MEIEELHWWDIQPEPQEGCEIQCPDCEGWFNHKDWTRGEVGCEDCGTHAALVCPDEECGCRVDHCGWDTLNSRMSQ